MYVSVQRLFHVCQFINIELELMVLTWSLLSEVLP